MSEKEIPHIHKALIKAAKRNNRKAQSELYELYYKAIYNCCLRIVNNTFVAEDLMHDSFIESFKNINQFNESATFGAWLKKIAINKSINYLKREKLIAHKLEHYSSIEEDENSETNLSIKEVKMALEQLPTNYRLVFSLYLIEGYDHEEIGSILNISKSTSRSQLSRAKKEVKRVLEQQKYSTT